MAKYDPGNEESVKARAKRVGAKKYAQTADLQAVLTLPEGRRFLARLLSNAGIYRPLFALNSLEIARNAAEHDWCLWLLQDLNRAEPGIVYRLAEELRSEEQETKGSDDGG